MQAIWEAYWTPRVQREHRVRGWEPWRRGWDQGCHAGLSGLRCGRPRRVGRHGQRGCGGGAVGAAELGGGHPDGQTGRHRVTRHQSGRGPGGHHAQRRVRVWSAGPGEFGRRRPRRHRSSRHQRNSNPRRPAHLGQKQPAAGQTQTCPRRPSAEPGIGCSTGTPTRLTWKLCWTSCRRNRASTRCICRPATSPRPHHPGHSGDNRSRINVPHSVSSASLNSLSVALGD
jgi:hypothetical protein